ncbi:MAG: riboflavin synthase [Bradymonadia bacterium]|jgi:riboflavin synthase
MFTGLIEAEGTVRRFERRGPGAQITLAAPPEMVAELVLGESVACDGACLTVTHAGGREFTVDASSETLQRTTLGERKIGDRLHLERALRLGDRLGGHMVAGHIDATGRVLRRQAVGRSLAVWFSAPPEVSRYLVSKGSIAIDGVSLTVNGVDPQGFDVVLIPHTQGVVHLAEKPVGARVNLEADIIGKYVERLMGGRSGGVDMTTLARAGFLDRR